MEKVVASAVFMAMLLLAGAGAQTLPIIPKPNSFHVKGTAVSIFDFTINAPPCAPDNVERVVKLYLSDLDMTVAVRFHEDVAYPPHLSCINVTGVIVPSCHGAEGTTALVTGWAFASNC